MKLHLALLVSLRLAAADPASEQGQRVLDEINLARAKPKAYAAYLRPWLDRFGGKLLKLEGEIDLVTVEGRPAVAEAVAFMESAKPLPPLSWSEGLHLAAMEHVLEQANGATGHAGKRGSTPFDRMERYGRWEETAGEAISYGPVDPRRVVLNLLVDDGVPGRGHRKSLFNAEFRTAGAALGSHATYGHLCVIDFAGGFAEKGPGAKGR